MCSHVHDRHLAAAIALWEPLAAFAWQQFTINGRGVVLIEQQTLEQAAGHVQSGQPANVMQMEPGYVCARDVPPSDDFAPIIAAYDPNRQVALLVKLADGEERLYMLETSQHQRRAMPRECFERQPARNQQQ